jgi:peptidoglycan hydrolase CwlO-like protein
MLLFSAFTQGLGSAVTYTSDVQNEIDRQKQICDEIDSTKQRLDKINGLIKTLSNLQPISADTDQKISDLNDDIIASNNRILELKKYYRKRLALIILTNIALVAMIALYIYFKTLQ